MRPAAFSAFLPKPSPEVLPLVNGAASCFSLGLKNEAMYELSGRENVGLFSPTGGRISSEPDLQARIERFCFAFTPRMSPRRMFKQPIEKRKKAATRVKSSTKWERMVAPIRHSKIPSGPRPNSVPRTGKNLSKADMGQLHSERMRMMT